MKKKVRIIIPLFVLSFLIILLSSCYYDNEEYMYGSLNELCDTVDTTYSGSVVPIIDFYCLSCHSNQTNQERGDGIILEGYDNIRTMALNGRLEGAVTHSFGYIPMPKDAKKLDECPINTIKQWINDGAPEN